MKKKLFVLVSVMAISCAAFAQNFSIDKVTPLKNAVQKAVKTLPAGYNFNALFLAVANILEEDAKTALQTPQVLEKQPDFIKGSREYAISSLTEAILAKSAYKRLQERNKELLEAFYTVGKFLQERGILFNADNEQHIKLVAAQLQKKQESQKKEAAERAKRKIDAYLEGLQKCTDYGIKY